MDHALHELICDDRVWTTPDGQGFSLHFNQDGTGELLAIGELGLGWLFALTMRWKLISTSSPAANIINDERFRHVKHTNMLTKPPTLLGSLRLEIELNRVAPELPHWSSNQDLTKLNDRMLSEAAYLPRQFTVVVERGNFAAAQRCSGRRELRMTFDISPYPLLNGYNHGDKSGPPREEIYEWLSQSRSFYAGKPSDELLQARATEDDTVLGYHTSRCVIS